MPPHRIVALECPHGVTDATTRGRVKVDGPGWLWIAGEHGAFHLTGPCGPRSPRTLVVDQVPALDLGTVVTVDLTGATPRPRQPITRSASWDDVLALASLLRPHRWNDPHTLALGHEPLADLAPRLIGNGPGLTPACDDAVCGYLAARFATRPAEARRDGDHVIAALDRTGEPSRSLLHRAADDGSAYASAERLLRRILNGDGTELAEPLRDLTWLGKTTGRAILTGILCGLAASAPKTPDHGS